MIIYLIKSCRLRQWTKNFLIFAPAIFSKDYYLFGWFNCVVAFFSFCLISSGIYLINDIIDIDSDRNHPTKCKRPIAAGKIKPNIAFSLSLLLITLSLIISSNISNLICLLITIYLFIQILYCLSFKNKPILDIFSISAGFLLRALVGVAAYGGNWSHWFLLTIGMLSLFLAIEKRKTELRNSEKSGILTRKVLSRYSLPLFQRLESTVTSCAFMAYALWSSGPNLNGAETSWMLITVPFVLIGIFRYQLISDPQESMKRILINKEDTTEKPEEILLRDKGIKITIFCWLLCVISVKVLYQNNLIT